MLSPIKSLLNCKRIILASGSPRRQELIKNIVRELFSSLVSQLHYIDLSFFILQGVNVELCPSLFEENLNPESFSSFSDFVEATAMGKVLEVFQRLQSDNAEPNIVIGADTVVTLNGKVYGKPKTKEDAFETLSEWDNNNSTSTKSAKLYYFRLNGKSHVVYTGVVIKYGSKMIKFTETANVQFGKANPEQIQAYVDTGEPM